MNIIEALDAAGIEWHPSESKSSEISICCPFCIEQGETPDERFRLGIETIGRKWAHCFNCNWGSKTDTHSKIFEALKIEHDEDSDEDERKEVKKVEFDGQLPDGFELLYPLKRDKTFQQAYFYLINRGVSESQIRHYKIGFTLVGKYSYRIIFPVYEDNELHGFVGRDFTGRQELRYLNSLGKKALYGKIHKDRSTAMIVEGAFDKLAINRVIRDVDSFALLQRTIRENQIKQLKNYDRIIRIPDDNRPGLNGLIKDCNKMQEAGLNVWYSRLSKKYEDVSYALNHHGKRDIKALVTNAEPWTEFAEKQLKLEIANDYRGVKEIA